MQIATVWHQQLLPPSECPPPGRESLLEYEKTKSQRSSVLLAWSAEHICLSLTLLLSEVANDASRRVSIRLNPLQRGRKSSPRRVEIDAELSSRLPALVTEQLWLSLKLVVSEVANGGRK